MHSTLLLLLTLPGPADEDLHCLGEMPEAQRRGIVYSLLQEQAFQALDRRQAVVDELTSEEKIRDRQRLQREFFTEQLGGFPERVPLEGHVTGKLDGDGYRIEKVIFASRPFHHVTASLYLPDSDGPVPGVVVASGHSRTGKAAEYNQRFGIALARNGMAALVYDPIGQGERSQILDQQGHPRHNSTTREHFLVGVGSILIGANTASYRVWDGIRAIDYLQSRPEIDGQRIGFTGCSGGGTLTSYVMALDDRVKCAAPACYLTTFRELIGTIGPQDAEQNIFAQVKFGMDQPDYVLMRAPQPTLISSTTDDFFSIEGAWDNFRQAKRIYTRLGHPERVDLVEADGKHGVQPENLTAIVRWMRRWLLDRDDAVTLEPFKYRSEQELQCVESGQVLLLSGERSVFDLNVERAGALREARQRLWKQEPAEQRLKRVRELASVRTREEIGKVEMKDLGRVQRDGYHIDKVLLTMPDGMPLPALTFHPPDPRDGAYLYLHGEGKHADGQPGGPIEELVSDGYVVVAVDLRGFGETRSATQDSLIGDWKDYYLAYLLGQSLVGLRAEDAIACGQWVANYQTTDPRAVHLVGVGAAGVPALHAAALEPQLFHSLELKETLESWEQAVGETDRIDALTNSVHGALREYDLPDLRKIVDAD